MRSLRQLSVLAVSAFAAVSCNVVQVDSDSHPPRLESRGIIDGHLALGVSEEDHLLHLSLFDGSSSGAIGELVIWKLFRLELGVAGASIGLGPLHAGLGTLFYEPEVPEIEQVEPEPEETAGDTEVPTEDAGGS